MKKVKYAFIAHSNTIHSIMKLTHIEILYGHVNTKSILDINWENKIVSVYINSCKERIKKLYEYIKEVNFRNEEKVQEKRN